MFMCFRLPLLYLYLSLPVSVAFNIRRYSFMIVLHLFDYLLFRVSPLVCLPLMIMYIIVVCVMLLRYSIRSLFLFSLCSSMLASFFCLQHSLSILLMFVPSVLFRFLNSSCVCLPSVSFCCVSFSFPCVYLLFLSCSCFYVYFSCSFLFFWFSLCFSILVFRSSFFVIICSGWCAFLCFSSQMFLRCSFTSFFVRQFII